LVDFDGAVDVPALSSSPGDAALERLGEADNADEDSRAAGVGDTAAFVTAAAVGNGGALGGGSADIAEAPPAFMIMAIAATSKLSPTPRMTRRRSQ